MSIVINHRLAFQYLTVREGWYLGYPIIGESPIQLVTAGRKKGSWQFFATDKLTGTEWRSLAAANYCHWYLLAGGSSTETAVPREWMLLVGKPTTPEYSTMRHFKPRADGLPGSGIGV